MNGIRRDISGLLSDHSFIPVNHSSIGSEDHCLCGQRPRGWRAWADHVADVVTTELGLATDPPPELPSFVTVESRTGTSARARCSKCDDFRSSGWASPREAFDWAYEHVKERHWLRAEMARAKARSAQVPEWARPTITRAQEKK